MADARTISGMRWLQKLKNSSTLLFDAEIDINLTSERARQMLIDAGVDYYFNFFFPFFKGDADEVNRWNYELSLRDPRCIPFASLLPGDDKKIKILDKAFHEYKCLGLKLHPYAQKFSAADYRLYEVYNYLQETGRPAVIHTGYEDLYKMECNQEELKKILKMFPRLIMIIPHLCYPNVDNAFRFIEEYPQIYLDATNVFWNFKTVPPKEIWWEKIELYSERIVFGTDFTMGMAFPRRIYKHFAQLPLSEKTKEDLLFRTAAKIVRQCGRELIIENNAAGI
jgi:hypothetical protein